MTPKNVLKTALPLLISSTALIPTSAHAQNVEDPTFIFDVDPASRVAVMGANMGINGFVCGIVAAAEERNILDDAGKCMAAGAIQYAGMEMGMHDVPVLPGVGLRVVETGTSVVENTLAGREPFEYLHYGLAPIFPGLLQIDTKKKEVDYYWNISPWVGLAHNAVEGNDFNILQSLSYQTFVFNQTNHKGYVKGDVIGSVMMYEPAYPDVAAHEFNHVLQRIRFRPAQEIYRKLTPSVFDFPEETLHLRLGEDIADMLFYLGKESGCAAIGYESHCSRRWWNLQEVESFTMQTAHEQYNPLH